MHRINVVNEERKGVLKIYEDIAALHANKVK
jgi:hypothetical protein